MTNQMQFFQLPKAFFQNPTYITMSLEAKIAYTILLDLLPLSIENNWVNDENQVYVKLSRTKLMALLGIKGTQKAAKVMKELVNAKLVINKKIGLGKCNEIYLSPLVEDGLEEKAAPKAKEEIATTLKAEEPKSEEAPKSRPSPNSLEAAMDEVEDLLAHQIHIDHLKHQYDPDFVDEIGHNIGDMYLSTSTRINQQDKPQSIIRGAIRKLKPHHIEHVIHQFMAVSAKTEILNPKGYIQSMIYNSIFEANTKVVGDIRRQFGYHC